MYQVGRSPRWPVDRDHRPSVSKGKLCGNELTDCDSLLMDCDDIGWNSSKIISRLVSLGCSLSADLNTTGLLQGNTAKFSPEWGWSMQKSDFGVQKL